MRYKIAVTVGLIFFLSATKGSADLIFTLVENGGNVQATLTGSLELNATLGFNRIATNASSFIIPTTGNITSGNDVSDGYHVNAPWTSFGTGMQFAWDATNGDRVALFSDNIIGVPVGYVSGSSLSGTATEFGTTFASLGITPGTYITTITNGAITDTVTVTTFSAVPEPSSLVALFGIAMLGMSRRRRQR